MQELYRRFFKNGLYHQITNLKRYAGMSEDRNRCETEPSEVSRVQRRFRKRLPIRQLLHALYFDTGCTRKTQFLKSPAMDRASHCAPPGVAVSPWFLYPRNLVPGAIRLGGYSTKTARPPTRRASFACSPIKDELSTRHGIFPADQGFDIWSVGVSFPVKLHVNLA